MQNNNELISFTAQQLLDEGLHCYNKKDLLGALFYFDNLLKLESDNIDLLYTLVAVCQELKDYEQALIYNENLISLSPNNFEFLLAQAESFFHLQNYVKALPVYLKLHNLHPLNTHIIERLLIIYTKQNKRSEVKKTRLLLLKTQNKTNDSQKEIYKTVQIALSLVEQEKNNEAKILLESVLLFDEKNINANGIYGALLSDEGEYEKALYYLDKIAFLASQEYILVYLKCLKEVRGYPSTIEYLNKRIVKYSSEDATKKILATYYYNNKEYKEAYEVARSISHKYPEDLSFTRLSAMSNFMSINEDSQWMNVDRLNSAAKQLHHIYKYFPKDENILIELIKFYLNIGEIKKAYDLTCNAFFENEKIKFWNKFPYYYATRNKKSYFESYLSGRVVRPLLINLEDIEGKIWNGESLKNKKVVILSEQGIGDELIFASNYQWIIKQALEVNIFCSARLLLAFSRLFPNAVLHPVSSKENMAFLSEEDKQNALLADVVILSGDLPALHYLKYKTPLNIENYYSVTEEKYKYWHRVVHNTVKENKPLVGIVWRSGIVNSLRSSHYLTYKEIAEIIAAIPELEFINCMYAECQSEVNYINKYTGRKLHQIPDLDQKNDFENTAALLSNLDLLIGASTATLSLCLAVGTPVVTYEADYLEEDGKLIKESLLYKNAVHISLPNNNSEKRKEAIKEIIKSIKNKFDLDYVY